MGFFFHLVIAENSQPISSYDKILHYPLHHCLLYYITPFLVWGGGGWKQNVDPCSVMIFRGSVLVWQRNGITSLRTVVHRQNIVKTSSGHRQDIGITSLRTVVHHQDIVRTSSGHRQVIVRTSLEYRYHIAKNCGTSSRHRYHIAKNGSTSSGHRQVIVRTSSGHRQDIVRILV